MTFIRFRTAQFKPAKCSNKKPQSQNFAKLPVQLAATFTDLFSSAVEFLFTKYLRLFGGSFPVDFLVFKRLRFSSDMKGMYNFTKKIKSLFSNP